MRTPIPGCAIRVRGDEPKMEAGIAGEADSPYYEYLAPSIRSMQPEAARQGLGKLADADPDVVVARLRDEVVRTGGCLVVWPVVAAWCRVVAVPLRSAVLGRSSAR